MELCEIHIRDPFILLDENTYFLYGSRGDETWGECFGLDVYQSVDLEKWDGSLEVFHRPDGFWANMNFWAPEVHKYQGKYYMFVSFKSKTRCRGTQILVADSPIGPFLEYSDGPVTPEKWECLDGTLYLDKNQTPYMIFCHEWLQVNDGEMWAVQLSADLKRSIGSPILLFKASEPAWALKDAPNYVTDGPFLHRNADGTLLMIWSSYAKTGYVEAISYSDNGEINGTWRHRPDLLFSRNGGHGMIFQSKSNEMMFLMHSPNSSPLERPVIRKIFERNNTLCLK